jgi:general secretion pathway protein L
MSTLVVQLAPRPRLRAGQPADAATPGGPAEYAWVQSEDGLAVIDQGLAPAALLPRLPTTVVVVAEGDVAWHRIRLPKANAARMKAALHGLLEEALLEESDAVHLALAPMARLGEPTWVAAVDRRWLRGEIAALEKAGVVVDRVVPACWPDDPPSGHFAPAADQAGGVLLHWAHADGVASLPIASPLARALLPVPLSPSTRWSAAPAAAVPAEQWLGQPVVVMPPADRALQAARSLWNLRQFDLAATNRGLRALRRSARQFFSAPWRPVRIGLAVAVALQVVGLNLWAWQQRAQVEERRGALARLVQETFPRANAVDIERNAEAVMRRELQALRNQAGKLGEGDLEALLFAAAGAWPENRPPAAMLRFEPGRLTLGTTGWDAAEVERFRAALQPAGWRVENGDGGLVVSRAPGAGL